MRLQGALVSLLLMKLNDIRMEMGTVLEQEVPAS